MFSGLFLSTTECSVIITNILKTIHLEEQDLFQRELYIGGDDCPYLL